MKEWDKKGKTFILLVVLFTLITIFISSSYAYFQTEIIAKDITVKVGELTYKIESELENQTVIVPSETNKVVNLKITSQNPITSKYQLYYQIATGENENFIVGYHPTSLNKPSGNIAPNETIEIQVILKNRTEENITVNLGIEAGLLNNPLELSNNKVPITEETLNTTLLKIDPNGGLWNGTTEITTLEKEVEHYDVVQEPTRDGYKFIGWENEPLINYGTSLYTDETFINGVNNMIVYDNLGKGNVSIERVARSEDNPVKDSSYMMKITTTGDASPGLGGFYQRTPTKVLGYYHHVIVAKIPVGYTLNFYSNITLSNDTKMEWITPNVGTGEFETYIYKMDCGVTGNLNINPTFGFLAIDGPAASPENPISWYVAYAAVLDAGTGTSLFPDTTFQNGVNSMVVYNNKIYTDPNNNNVTIEKVLKSEDDLLADTNFMIKIQNIGEAHPSLGGFVQFVPSEAGGVYYQVVYAKIPKGMTVFATCNPLGDKYSVTPLTEQKGTGNFEKYIFQIQAGQTGDFNTFGHIYIEDSKIEYGSIENPITWYVGYSNIFDASDIEGNFATRVYKYTDTNSVIKARWYPV